MSQELWAKALAYIVPNLTTILTTVGIFLNFIHRFKKNNESVKNELQAKVDRISKMEKDVAITKAKVESIENYLIDKEKK